jgi:hypothetical protein
MVLASFVGVLFVPGLFVLFELMSERVARLFTRRRAEPAE